MNWVSRAFEHFGKIEFTLGDCVAWLFGLDSKRCEYVIWIIIFSLLNIFQIIKLLQILFSMRLNRIQQISNRPNQLRKLRLRQRRTNQHRYQPRQNPIPNILRCQRSSYLIIQRQQIHIDIRILISRSHFFKTSQNLIFQVILIQFVYYKHELL